MNLNFYGQNLMQHLLLPDPHVFGPDTARGYSVAVSAGWDAEAERTSVTVRPLLPVETPLVYVDDDGNRRLRRCDACLVHAASTAMGGTPGRCVTHTNPSKVAGAAADGLLALETHDG